MSDSLINQVAESLWGDKDSAHLTVKGDERLSGEQRLSLYRDSVRSILINTLKKTFSVCDQIVGDEFFNALAYRYVLDRPSLNFDLDDYGADFPDFIAQFEPAKQLPYLVDVARLEWYWQAACLAPASEALDLSFLNGHLMHSDYQNLFFKLPTFIAFLESDYPIQAIWEMHQEKNEATVDLSEGGVRLVVSRIKMPVIIDVSPEQWYLLNALRRDISFEELFCNFEKHFPEDEFVEHFASLIKLGLVQYHQC